LVLVVGIFAIICVVGHGCSCDLVLNKVGATMNRIRYILIGIAVGIVGVFIYQVWGKPAVPTYDGWADSFGIEDTQPIIIR
jgi:hypothetical protein